MSVADPIYLDYAAATPLDDRVLLAMQPYFKGSFYNPSATYSAARRIRQDLETARTQVAHWLGARPNEIIFTAGGTEANNLAVHGIMQSYPEGNVITSAIEHESVLAPASRYAQHLAPVDADGIIDLEALEQLINDRTVLISIMYANNEVGSLQPLKMVSRLIVNVREQRQRQGIKRPIYFHTDAAQAGNYLDLHASRLGVDMMTLNGGKIYGPKQSGVLYVKGGIEMQPQVLGGGQERNFRSGTENVAGCVGLAAALDIAQQIRHEEGKRLRDLQIAFLDRIRHQLPTAVINGSLKHRLPNNVHLTLPGQDNERLLFALDGAGVEAAAGSACSASDEAPSHVLKSMGISEDDARASLRLTMGRSTQLAEIESVVSLLAKLIA